MMSMQFSGYNEKFKSEIVKSALNAYKTIIDKDKKGEKPMYRKKDWERENREKTKRAKKENWFKKGDKETVVFIPTTPGSFLKKKYEEIISQTKIKMKVVEKRGRTLLSCLQRKGTRERRCVDNCMICEKDQGEKQALNCKKENVRYEFICEICKKTYIGETARNAKSR